MDTILKGLTLRRILREPKDSGSLRQFFTHSQWSPDSTLLASGTRDHHVRIWDVEGGDLLHTISFPFRQLAGIACHSVAWSPDASTLAFGGLGKVVYLWDRLTYRMTREMSFSSGPIKDLAWSPDGTQLAVCAGDHAFTWKVTGNSCEPLWKFRDDVRINRLAWSWANDTLLAGMDTGELVFLYEASTPRENRTPRYGWLSQMGRGYHRIYAPPGVQIGKLYSPVKSIAWAPDGRSFVWGADDSAIQGCTTTEDVPPNGILWDTPVLLQGHSYPVTSLAFSYDGRLLCSKSRDGTVRLWRCDTWEEVALMSEPTHDEHKTFASVSFHPSQLMLATGSASDAAIRIWDIDYEVLCSPSSTRSEAVPLQTSVQATEIIMPPDADALDPSSLTVQLASVGTGSEFADDYHELILKALSVLFEPHLRNPKKEARLHEGRKRVDIVFDNRAERGFFGTLTSRHGIRAPYIFFECKNYNSDVNNPEFDQLMGRFSERRGQFGVLVCRHIEDDKKALQRCRDVLHDSRGWIIILQDKDVQMMLQLKASDDDEAISDYLENFLRRLVM